MLISTHPRRTFALKSLLDESVQQRTAVIAKSESFETVNYESVGYVDAETLALGALGTL